MAQLSIDDHFRRFQRSGDPSDLAAVYDRSAPELLRVAIHLSGKPAEAEDLLQCTFLTAIERVESFDPGRRVLPWLLGILANHARNLRRRGDPEQATEDLDNLTVEDPVLLAEAEEFSRALDGAIARLPEVYRPVFLLRFKHGLATGEIAKALDRPAGTVRTQLVRGLEMLRRTLPVSFVAGAAALLLSDRGLGAVRRTVLERAAMVAGAHAAGAGAAVTLGVGIMTKKMSLLSVGIAVALGAAYWGFAVTGSPSRSMEPDTPAELAASAGSEAAVPGTGPERSPDRGTPATERSEAREQAPNTLRILGRCVRAEDGRPLSGCRVTTRIHVRDLKTSDTRYEKLSEPCLSSIDGSFLSDAPALRTIPAGAEIRCALAVSAPGRATVRQSLKIERSKPDVGDIRLWKGYPVRGRIVDRSGTPVPEVLLRVEGLPNALSVPSHGGDARLGKSATDGSFEGPDPVPVGVWPLRAYGSGVKLVSPDRVEVVSTARHLEVVVQRARERPTISGRVLDEADRPVAGLVVQARHEWEDHLKASTQTGGVFFHPRQHELLRGEAVTDRSGRFRIVAKDDDPPAVNLGSFGWGKSGKRRLSRPFHDERAVEWGSTGIELRVQLLAPLEVEVVEASNGQPVEDFAVFCWPMQPEPPMLTPLHVGGSPNGRVRVSPPAIGEHWLLVVPRRRELLASRRQQIRIEPTGTTRIRVALDAGRTLRVRVVFGDGSPVAGSRLRLYDASGISGRLDPESGHIPDYRQAFDGKRNPVLTPRASSPFWAALGLDTHLALIVADKAVTDADGGATLVVPSQGRRALHALGPGHLPTLVEPIQGNELSVTVERGASLEVRLRPLSVLKLVSWVKLRHRDHQQPRQSWGSPRSATIRQASFAVDGILHEADLAPGPWSLALLGTWLYGGSAQKHLELEAGKTRRLELDLSRFTPARVEGKVLLDGKPPYDAEVTLVPDLRNPVGPGFDIDGQGRFLAPAVLPGSYQLSLTLNKSQPEKQVIYPLSEPFRLMPGGSHSRRFSFHHRRLRVRVLDKDGVTPVAETRFIVGSKSLSGQVRARTDAEGRFVLEPAPEGTITLTLHGKGSWFQPMSPEELAACAEGRILQRPTIGPLQVPGEDSELVVKLR